MNYISPFGWKAIAIAIIGLVLFMLVFVW